VENFFSFRHHATVNHFVSPIIVAVHFFVFIRVTLATQQFKVAECQRDLWVIHGARCDMLDLVVNYFARRVDPLLQTVLT
jgi:hypothetical protein